MSLPEKPLHATMEGQVGRPEEIYFFQRENGEIIHVGEKGAWSLYSGRNRVIGQQQERLKIIGVGTGHLFIKGVLEAKELSKTQGIPAAQERLRKAVQEELEACRGKVKIPRNFDQLDRQGNPVNLNTIGKW